MLRVFTVLAGDELLSLPTVLDSTFGSSELKSGSLADVSNGKRTNASIEKNTALAFCGAELDEFHLFMQ
jgi:hypothetical protein